MSDKVCKHDQVGDWKLILQLVCVWPMSCDKTKSPAKPDTAVRSLKQNMQQPNDLAWFARLGTSSFAERCIFWVHANW